MQAIKQVDEKLNLEDTEHLDEAEKSHLLKLYRETMLQCYNFGFEVRHSMANIHHWL